MYKKLVILLWWVTIPTFSFAQKVDLGAIQELEEVIITNPQLEDFSTGQYVLELNDSLRQKNPIRLSELIQLNTPFFIRENGYGMVASPSFRGTTAQQTAVVWNGININSQFNGQGDFNTLLGGNFNRLSIRPGGGSVVYGTGAIGGSVHLDTELQFNQGLSQEIQMLYGEFNTIDSRYRGQFSTKKWSFQWGANYNYSDNDFPTSGNLDQNTNARFKHLNINLDLAHQLNENNLLKFYTWIFDSERNLPIKRISENRPAYENLDIRNLIEWENKGKNYSSILRMAFLREDFSYQENKNRPTKTSNLAETFHGRYDFAYRWKKFKFNSLLNYENAKASGDNLEEDRRIVLATSLIAKYEMNKQLTFQASARKEWSNLEDSPLLYSAGINWKATSFYQLKFNASKNFRIPTFNDLFWNNSGQSDLQAETAQQFELGHHFHLGKFIFSATAFYNDIDQLIRWIPNPNGNWQPENVDRVNTYGGEFTGNYQLNFGDSKLQLNANYALVKSINQNTKNQLTYTPIHKTNFSSAYAINNWQFTHQFLWVGEQFAQTDNNPDRVLEAYQLHHLLAHYTFSSKPVMQAGIRVYNVFNSRYESADFRPMPGRMFNLEFLIQL